jgi:hypothetical protein
MEGSGGERLDLDGANLVAVEGVSGQQVEVTEEEAVIDNARRVKRQEPPLVGENSDGSGDRWMFHGA